MSLCGALCGALVGGCTADRQPGPPPPPATAPPRQGGEITVALVLPDPDGLDPARAASPGERILAANLFDSLTTVDRDGKVQPAAAASWSSDLERRTWTFRLRPGATFGDGEPVTARSFVTAWQRVAASPSPAVRALLTNVAGARGAKGTIRGLAAPDDATLMVALTKPSADFPALVAEPALAPVPRAATEDPKAFAARPVGNGPFTVAEAPAAAPKGGSKPAAPTRTLVLAKRAGAGAAGGPYLDRVTVLAVPDEQTAWLAFQEGRAQFAPVPLDQLDGAMAVYGQTAAAGGRGGLLSSPAAGADVLGFALGAAPFSDRRARLGIALAIDRARLAGRFSGARVPADALVPDGVRAEAGAACAPCGHDPAQARTLLAEAGVKTVTLAVPATAAGRTLAEALAADLQAVGVKVKVDRAGEGPLTRARRAGLTLVTLLAPPGAGTAAAYLVPFYGAAGSAWAAGGADQTVGGLLDQAAATGDEAARLHAARQAQDRLEAEALAVPLLEHRNHAVVAPGILGLDLSASGLLDLAAVSLTQPTAG